jgi:hypothetical protein
MRDIPQEIQMLAILSKTVYMNQTFRLCSVERILGRHLVNRGGRCVLL